MRASFPWVLTGCVTATAAGLPSAQAANWQYEPSYGVQIGFDDNYTLDSRSGRSLDTNEVFQKQVSFAKASAELVATQRQPARSIDLSARLDGYSFSGDNEGLDDRVDSRVGLNWNQIGERSNFNFQLRYLSDSLLQDITLSTAEISNVDNDDGLVREDVGRSRLTLSPSYRYQLTPISSFAGSIWFAAVEHDNTDNTFLIDYEESRVNLRYDREFSPINSWAVDAEVRQYEGTNADQNYDSSVIGASLLHKFDETSEIGLRVAAASTDYETTEDNTRTEGEASSTLVQLFGSKTTGRARYAFRLGNDLYGSGSGDVVRATEALANVVYQWSERPTITWQNKLFENKSLNESEEFEDSNRRYLALEPSVNWRFSRWWVMDFGYRYRREKRDSRSAAGESNYVFVGVTYSKPLGVVVDTDN